MPNAKDVDRGIQTVLIVGGTGSGKTTQFLTFPGKKFAYIFDQNALASLRGFDIEYEAFIPEQLDLDVVSLKANTRDKFSKPPEPKTYINFELDFENKLDTGFFDDFDSVAVDSTTMLTDIVMDRMLYLNGRFGKQPEQIDYVGTTNTIIKIYRSLLGLQKPIYVTGHIEFKQDEATGRMQNIMSFLGRLRQRLPIMFSEVWLAYADPDRDENMHYYIQTRQDRKNPFLRCSSRLIANTEDVTLDFNKTLEGQGIGGLLAQE